jgi:branched-chain amino acid aminotransferase
MVPASDEGLLRGDGAFELMRVYRGHPFALTEHLARLERTCATVRLACDRKQIECDIDAIVAELAGRGRRPA